MSLHSALRSILLLTATGSIAAATTAACANRVDRQPITDDAPATPSQTPEMPERSSTPSETPQSAPVATGDDAGAEPDAPDTCKHTAPSNTCGLVPQCGCTLAETCDVADTAGNVECVTAGKAAMGAPCLATAGCAVGLTCVFGTCHAFCGTAGSACTVSKTGKCHHVKGQGSVLIPNLLVCRIACDLRDVNACGGTTAAGTGACQVDDNGETDCAAGGTKAVGQACSPTEDCAPGAVCTLTGTGTVGTCKKWCRVGTNDCGGTTACSGFQPKVIVAGVEHGPCP